MTHRTEPEPATQPGPTFAVCPACGGWAVHDVTRQNRGVWMADYICNAGHGWMVKWLVASA